MNCLLYTGATCAIKFRSVSLRITEYFETFALYSCMFLHIQKLGQEWKPDTSVRGSEEQTEQREHPSGEAEGGEATDVITEEQIEELMRAETNKDYK